MFNIIDDPYALWKTFGYASIGRKNILRFAGLAAKLFGRTDVQRKCLTYLPPITKPITEYGNIIVLFYQSHVLSQNCNI